MQSVKSAVVSTLLSAALVGLTYVIGLGDVFLIDYKHLFNIVVIAVLVGLVSLIKSALTSDQTGKFAGVVQVKEPVKTDL